ncbi:MAG: hypothetical protein V3S20_03640, partial [Dehalococcoidia bacterium]
MRRLGFAVIGIAAIGLFLLVPGGRAGVTEAGVVSPAIDAAEPDTGPALVRPEVTEALAQEPNVNVIIALRTDQTPVGRSLAHLKHEVSAKQGSVLSALTAPDFVVSRLYDAVPAIAGRITPAA